jgi:hypothetical protein
VKHATLRAIGIIAAVLFLGSVALAVAVGTQSPGASQIPTVVTGQPTASPVVTSLTATPTVPPSSDATKAVLKPTPPESGEGADSHSSSPASKREVVTPSVRDDNDADDNGGESDHDSDDAKSSSNGQGDSKNTESSSGSTIKHSESKTSIGTQSTHSSARMRIAASTRVERGHSSGKNVRGRHN